MSTDRFNGHSNRGSYLNASQNAAAAPSQSDADLHNKNSDTQSNLEMTSNIMDEHLLKDTKNGYNGYGSKTLDGNNTKYKRRSRLSSFVSQTKATVLSSTMNLINTVIGAGILGLPAAVADTGYILAIFLFVIFGATAFFGNTLQFEAQACVPNCTYNKLAKMTIPKFFWIVDITVGLTCFGVCIAYFTVIGDLCQDFLKDFIDEENTGDRIYGVLTDRVFWQTIYLFIFIIPISYLKKLDSLRFTSTLAIICFMIVTFTVVLYWLFDGVGGIDKEGEGSGDVGGVNAFPNRGEVLTFLKAAPIYIFAYTCNQNTFAVANELENPSLPRLNLVILLTVVFCGLVYALVGYAGYLTYGDAIEGNLLISYPDTKYLGIVRFALSLAIAFSYPVLNHAARSCIGCVIFRTTNVDYVHPIKYYVLTYTLVALSFFIALIADNLQDILSFIGASGTTVISFILPGLFYYKMEIHKLKQANGLNAYQSDKWIQIKKKAALAMIIAGCIIGPLSILFQFI